MRKRGKVSLHSYFHPKLWNCENVSWLNGLLASALRVKHGWLLLNLIGVFCIEFGVLQVTGFWTKKEVLNPKVSIKEVLVRFALIG